MADDQDNEQPDVAASGAGVPVSAQGAPEDTGDAPAAGLMDRVRDLGSTVGQKIADVVGPAAQAAMHVATNVGEVASTAGQATATTAQTVAGNVGDAVSASAQKIGAGLGNLRAGAGNSPGDSGDAAPATPAYMDNLPPPGPGGEVH